MNAIYSLHIGILGHKSNNQHSVPLLNEYPVLQLITCGNRPRPRPGRSPRNVCGSCYLTSIADIGSLLLEAGGVHSSFICRLGSVIKHTEPCFRVLRARQETGVGGRDGLTVHRGTRIGEWARTTITQVIEACRVKRNRKIFLICSN